MGTDTLSRTDLLALREKLVEVRSLAAMIGGPDNPEYHHLALSCDRAVSYVDEDIENAPRNS